MRCATSVYLYSTFEVLSAKTIKIVADYTTATKCHKDANKTAATKCNWLLKLNSSDETKKASFGILFLIKQLAFAIIILLGYDTVYKTK